MFVNKLLIAVFIFLSLQIAVHAQYVSQARNQTQTACVERCSGSDDKCCGCCDHDQTCNGYPETHACCSAGQAFCGCFDYNGTCQGIVFGAAEGTVVNQDGVCYDYAEYDVCSYAFTNLWILCPNNYTVCYSYDYSDATCCLESTELCSLDPNDRKAQCISGTPQSNGSPVVCGGKICGDAGNLCCDDVNLGPTCYDQTAYTCQTSGLGSVLCGNMGSYSEEACGDACYSRSEYYCCNDQLYQVGQRSSCSPTSAPTSSPTNAPTNAPSNAPTDAPSSAPTNAPTSSPTSSPTSNPGQSNACGSMTCAGSDRCCNDAAIGAVCYDPVNYNCTQGSSGLVLCGYVNGKAEACGTACYDASSYRCCNGQLMSGADGSC